MPDGNGAAARNRTRWKVRILITVVLIWPLYVGPTLLRSLASGWGWWVAGVVAADVIGCFVVGFLTNNIRFAVLLYVMSSAVEAGLVFGLGMPRLALWFGDLIPAAVAIYFAQQLFLNMGD